MSELLELSSHPYFLDLFCIGSEAKKEGYKCLFDQVSIANEWSFQRQYILRQNL